MHNPFIYLASKSPRRAQLLDRIGVRHEPLLADQNENIEIIEEPRSRELPEDYVRRVAKLKLEAARRRRLRRGLPEAPILTADTTVCLGRRLLLKPDSPDHAREMLHALAGRTHRVLTAVYVSAGVFSFMAMTSTRVRLSRMSRQAIDAYVETGEPLDKAGAYAIQGRAALWVERIEGSYTGVVGLPLHETATLLRQARIPIL